MGVEGLDIYREKFIVEVRGEFARVMRAQKQQVGLVLMTHAIDLTPVDTGEARRGWFVAAPRPSDDVRQSDNPIDELVKVTNESSPEDPLYIQNNVDHIKILDEGGFVPPDPGPSKDPRKGRTGRVLVANGYSLQAPHGISGEAVDATAADTGMARGTWVS